MHHQRSVPFGHVLRLPQLRRPQRLHHRRMRSRTRRHAHAHRVHGRLRPLHGRAVQSRDGNVLRPGWRRVQRRQSVHGERPLRLRHLLRRRSRHLHCERPMPRCRNVRRGSWRLHEPSHHRWDGMHGREFLHARRLLPCGRVHRRPRGFLRCQRPVSYRDLRSHSRMYAVGEVRWGRVRRSEPLHHQRSLRAGDLYGQRDVVSWRRLSRRRNL